MNQTKISMATSLLLCSLLCGNLSWAGVSADPVLVKQTNEIDIYEARDLYIVKVLDPLADINKVISDFNAETYQVVKKPASFYKQSPLMIPIRWPLTAAANIMSNIGELTVGTSSNLLTGKFADAGSSVSRSIINLVALGGIFDVATTLSEKPVTDAQTVENMGVMDSIGNSMRSDVEALRKPEISNFDDVFRTWGFGCGVYLVFPFVGPGTGREAAGKVAQMPLQPETYVQPMVLVRIAGAIHQGLSDVERAKVFLQDYDLSTEDGKQKYYDLLRNAILSSNQCIDDEAVKAEALKEGMRVTDEE